MTRRTERLNSLLKEVISEVIKKDVRNQEISELLTVTRVDISLDLRHAKVYVSIMGSDEVKRQTLEGLQQAAGFIAVHSSKLVVMRYFPDLTFKLDDSVDKHMRIEELLKKIHDEQQVRSSSDEHESKE